MPVLDVNPNKLIEKAAEELKKIKEIQPPAWAKFVKTGISKERPPLDQDWWYKRTAAILRRLYTSKKPIGVSKLRTKYGGRKNRGYKPEKYFRGSGSIIRKVLQQLDKIGFSVQTKKGVHKGRIITPKGMSFLDKITKTLK